MINLEYEKHLDYLSVLRIASYHFDAEAQDLLTTQNLRDQVDLSGLEISPDGQHILLITTRQNYESNKLVSELLMIDVSSKEQRTISKHAGISTATWSPDGDQIAFLATVRWCVSNFYDVVARR